jgi:hypothetical protein
MTRRTNPGEFGFAFYLESRDMSLEVACLMEYEPGGGDGWNEPRYEPRVNLINAKVGGVDIAPALTADQIAAIEQKAFEERASDMAEDEAERQLEDMSAYWPDDVRARLEEAV